MSKYNIFQNIGKKPVEDKPMKATSKMSIQTKLNALLVAKAAAPASQDAAILQPVQ